MSKTIDQFMWGFQNHFRWNVEYDTKLVLDQLGIASTDAKVILEPILKTD